MKKTLIALAVILAVAGIARIARGLDCDHAYTTVEMKECAAIDYQKADSDLNAVYEILVDAIKKSGNKKAKDKLVEAQREWISFRDKDCEFEAEFNAGGTLQGIVYTSCLTDRTRKRVTELRAYYDIWK